VTKVDDIILKIIEEYIKLKMSKNDKKSLGKHKSKSKRQSQES